MWIIEPPSSTTRRASAAYSSGVYGIAGHWSRLATVPEIELVRITGSSKRLMRAPPPRRRRATRGSGRRASRRASSPDPNWPPARRTHGAPRPSEARALGHLERTDHDRPRLARVDHVVDHVVPRSDVGVDDLAEVLDQLGPLRVRVLGRLDLLAQDDVHGALCAHHRYLGRGPGDDQIRLVGLAAH